MTMTNSVVIMIPKAQYSIIRYFDRWGSSECSKYMYSLEYFKNLIKCFGKKKGEFGIKYLFADMIKIKLQLLIGDHMHMTLFSL